LPLAQQWLDKNGVEPVKRQQFDAFLQANPAAANVQSEADKETLFEQFHAWAAGMNAQARIGPEVDTKKVQDRDHASQSKKQAAPLRHSPRRSQLARRLRSPLTEQGAMTECHRDLANQGACNRANEDGWNLFAVPTTPPGQGLSNLNQPPNRPSER
jgi:hypothetical protein